jgi:flagellar motor switch protein FliN/FliY
MAKNSDQSNVDQDKLAEEWAAALAEQEEGDSGSEEEPAASSQDSKEKDQDALAEEWAKALADQEEEEITKEKKNKQRSAKAQDYEFKDLAEEDQGKSGVKKRDMEFILDIPLNVSAELGRSKLLINDLLQLGQGSVIELDKLAGEPLEVMVNGKLVARGEAVVINEKFGVRLTDIISPMERVKQLG